MLITCFVIPDTYKVVAVTCFAIVVADDADTTAYIFSCAAFRCRSA
jgi:hypothetical protein